MAGFGYTRRVVALDSTSANSATTTSNAVLVADWNAITISWVTQSASASLLTIQGTDADGFTATIAAGEWSTVTQLSGQGVYAIEPGLRWIRAGRSAIDSQGSVVVAGRSY